MNSIISFFKSNFYYTKSPRNFFDIYTFCAYICPYKNLPLYRFIHISRGFTTQYSKISKEVQLIVLKSLRNTYY